MEGSDDHQHCVPWGGNHGGDESPTFATQCAGLQGLWEEVYNMGKMSMKSTCRQWFIEGLKAIECLDGGVPGRIFAFQQDGDGRLLWGNGRRYALDSHFCPGMVVACWRQVGTGKRKPFIAFVWRQLQQTPQVQSRESKRPVAGAVGEKRIDPSDDQAYTWQELQLFYAPTYTEQAMKAYWEQCEVWKEKCQVVSDKHKVGLLAQLSSESSDEMVSDEMSSLMTKSCNSLVDESLVLKEFARPKHADVFPTLLTLPQPHLRRSAPTASRAKNVYLAKLAEKAERYDEMAGYMEELGKSDEELSVQERNLFSIAYKNAVGRRRAVWRVITNIEEKERTEGNQKKASFAKEYRSKVEAELQKICDTLLSLLDKKRIPRTASRESKAFFVKMKADYYRYIAEFTHGDRKKEALQGAKTAYADATAVAEMALVVTHPLRLGLALNYSVFMYEMLDQPDEAYKMSCTAFEAAIGELGNLSERGYKDSTLIMQLLRDNLTLWNPDHEPAVVPR